MLVQVKYPENESLLSCHMTLALFQLFDKREGLKPIGLSSKLNCCTQTVNLRADSAALSFRRAAHSVNSTKTGTDSWTSRNQIDIVRLSATTMPRDKGLIRWSDAPGENEVWRVERALWHAWAWYQCHTVVRGELLRYKYISLYQFQLAQGTAVPFVFRQRKQRLLWNALKVEFSEVEMWMTHHY